MCYDLLCLVIQKMVFIRLDLPDDLDKKVSLEKVMKGYSSKEVTVIKLLSEATQRINFPEV
jgi:alpha-galactosidase